MMVGHYAPAFALKSFYRDVPLWVLMLAVQFLDVLFFILVPLRIESFQIDPAAQGFLALKLDYMPFSHSLLMTVTFGIACIIGGHLVGKRRVGIAVSLAVMSHWFLDLIVHTPDLPFGFGESKVGFGLWRYPAGEFSLEVCLLIIGAVFMNPVFKEHRLLILAFVMLLISVQVLMTFVFSVPASPNAVAVLSQCAYFSFAALAYFIERRLNTGTNDPTRAE